MGMHREGSNREFDPIERNTRRQVWFSIYILEKILCSVLGRPTVIDDSEMTMRLPDASMLEQQNVSTEFMERTFQISQMSYRMRQRAYFDTSTAEGEQPRIREYIRLMLIVHLFRAIPTTQSGSEPPSRMRRVLFDAPTTSSPRLFTAAPTGSESKSLIITSVLLLHTMHSHTRLSDSEGGEGHFLFGEQITTYFGGLGYHIHFKRGLC
jgi:hypothetical protein